MKLPVRYFHCQPSVKTKPLTSTGLGKEGLPSIQECSSEGSTNQSIVSIVEQKNGWFLFRIIRQRSKSPRHNQNTKHTKNIPSPTSSRGSSTPTSATSSTKKNSNITAKEIENDTPLSFYDTPISFVRINNKTMDESPQQESFIKLTSRELVTSHGLQNNDSIIAYFQDVSNAYNQMVVLSDNNNDKQSISNKIVDDYDKYFEEFYNNTTDQSISVITMDPAIAYNHSIVILDDNYSFKSFKSRDYVDDDNKDSEEEEEMMVPLRYYHI